MIPVMLFGVLFAKKRYSLRDYMCVGLITAGIVTFNLSKASHTSQKVFIYGRNKKEGRLAPPWGCRLDSVLGSFFLPPFSTHR